MILESASPRDQRNLQSWLKALCSLWSLLKPLTYSQALALCPIVQCIWPGWSQEDERHPAPQEREHSSHTPDLGEEPEVYRYDKTRLCPPTTCGKTWTQMKVFGPLCSLCFSEWGLAATYHRNVQWTQEAKRHAKVQRDEEAKWWNFLSSFEDIVPKCSYHKYAVWWRHSQTNITQQNVFLPSRSLLESPLRYHLIYSYLSFQHLPRQKNAAHRSVG